ncbi:CehA/McbA family metallohydrolase [Crossiella sp. CA198]|uniref:CehA/McbA family metallohydrolase n=1 Tax=Crossiella sp. CA198 TaxID=3455607 RepID=UPI003F8D41AB
MGEVGRRGFLRGVGAAAVGAPLLGAGTANAGVGLNVDLDLELDLGLPRLPGAHRWLVGDHHIHTQYSNDAMYTVDQVVAGARRHGAEWLVFSDHGHVAHEANSVEPAHADIVAARRRHPGLLLWQGLEWNMPAAEHATVFLPPSRDEAALLREFERTFDSRLTNTGASTPANEAKALEALHWLDKRGGLVVVNHPSRNGRIAPAELRNWHDAAPGVVIGMEGAPGAQGDGHPKPEGSGGHRGGYGNSPGGDSWPGFPAEAYRTFGGFDWMSATLGGLWDSLLAEGRNWWITSNSDSHFNFRDTIIRQPEAGDLYDRVGKHLDPLPGGPVQTQPPYCDFYPGEFSRTVVGATERSYRGVMDGLRAGRTFVSHGGLVQQLETHVFAEDRLSWPVGMGGRLRVRRGTDITVVVLARLAARPHSGGEVPRLARLDLVRGAVTGKTADRQRLRAPETTVARSFEPRFRAGHVVGFRHTFRDVRESFYLRARGTDGRRHTPGGLEPIQDVRGEANPWQDLWCYANPVFIDVR